MARALAAGAFRSYKTWGDVCAITKPKGREHTILEFEDHALDFYVFPRCLLDGSVDNADTSASLASHGLRLLGVRTGFRESLTFHAARREALLKVDSECDGGATHDDVLTMCARLWLFHQRKNEICGPP